MASDFFSDVRKRFLGGAVALAAIVAVGTVGYWLLCGREPSLLDCVYMTVITISTIGFGEIVDLTHNPAGRVFTMAVALSGIGTLTYMLSSFTAFVVEGQMKEVFRRRRMEREAGKLSGHYIVCGVEGVGFHVADELRTTRRPCVVVDVERKKVEKLLDAFPEHLFVEGDATDNDTLRKAGIEKAAGLFASTGDDNLNLVISLTARQLNPAIRVVARCHDVRNVDKMRKAGADAVVSPFLIGGLRMASEMVRPQVVSFLDTMLRDKDNALRIEEVDLPPSFRPTALLELNLRRYPNVLLLAVRDGPRWAFNPPDEHMIRPGQTLVFMTTPGERKTLESLVTDMT